jgi:hypothetical protein
MNSDFKSFYWNIKSITNPAWQRKNLKNIINICIKIIKILTFSQNNIIYFFWFLSIPLKVLNILLRSSIKYWWYRCSWRVNILSLYISWSIRRNWSKRWYISWEYYWLSQICTKKTFRTNNMTFCKRNLWSWCTKWPLHHNKLC